jgi:predicted metal-dependent hydrolase
MATQLSSAPLSPASLPYAQIEFAGICVDVIHKDIQNIHLSVFPPTGAVRIAAPLRMNLETIRMFAITKLGWIRSQQKRLNAQQRETPREYLERESHYVWGKRYLLEVIEHDAAPTLELKHSTLRMNLRPQTATTKRQEILGAWYRERLKEKIPALIAKWEPILGVKVKRFFVQRMKTKWGSCTPKVGYIRLNTELAKKPPECLEYVVVHEMMHLLEPTHNKRFMALMDQFMPNWKLERQKLNELPSSHELWRY